MKNQFAEKMAGQTDAGLLEIVNERRGDYLPEAIEAAEVELAKRNLSVEQVQEARSENAVRAEIRADRANEPLIGVFKLMAFILPGVLPIMFSGTFKADGYDRKAKDLLRFTLYGFIFYVALVIALSVF